MTTRTWLNNSRPEIEEKDPTLLWQENRTCFIVNAFSYLQEKGVYPTTITLDLHDDLIYQVDDLIPWNGKQEQQRVLPLLEALNLTDNHLAVELARRCAPYREATDGSLAEYPLTTTPWGDELARTQLRDALEDHGFVSREAIALAEEAF